MARTAAITGAVTKDMWLDGSRDLGEAAQAMELDSEGPSGVCRRPEGEDPP